MNRQQQQTENSSPATPIIGAAQRRPAPATPADNAEHHNDRGIVLARRGKFEAAAAELRTAIGIRPGYAKAHNNLGIVYAQLHRLADSAAAFRAALAYRPDMAEAQNNLGNVLAMQGRLEEAIECFRRAIGLKPGYAEAYNNLGIAHAEQGKLAETIAVFDQLLKMQPGSAPPAIPIAPACSVTMNSATAACARALDIPPTLSLAVAQRQGPTDPQLAALAALAERDREIPENSRIALHFALGQAYESRREPDRAFPHFLEGNILKRATLGYDESAALAAMQNAQRSFDAGRISALRGTGDTTAAPIFILGMPRSGHTLLEQMLAGHPDVVPAGDRSDFSRLAAAIPAPDSCAAETLRQLGTDYLNAVNAKFRRRARITDKLAGNFLHAGLIHLALPNARIIHLRRGPADTCLSCYTTLFRIGHAYSFDLAELGRYYRAYAQLMDHWRAVLPASVMIEVDYEALVADPKGQITRILDHCGLPWSDSCLAGRAPLHGRSVGRWQRYAAYVAPLLSELQKDVLF